MFHIVTLKINIDVPLLYGQNKLPWQISAKHLWPIPAKTFPRCEVGINLFHVRSNLQSGTHLAGPRPTALARWRNL